MPYFDGSVRAADNGTLVRFLDDAGCVASSLWEAEYHPNADELGGVRFKKQARACFQ